MIKKTITKFYDAEINYKHHGLSRTSNKSKTLFKFFHVINNQIEIKLNRTPEYMILNGFMKQQYPY
jgi:hypothetical protein